MALAISAGVAHVEKSASALEAEALASHRAQGLEGVHRDVVRPQLGGQSQVKRSSAAFDAP